MPKPEDKTEEGVFVSDAERREMEDQLYRSIEPEQKKCWCGDDIHREPTKPPSPDICSERHKFVLDRIQSLQETVLSIQKHLL